jgi:uncharacterized protein YecT (DUF1311 family)
MRLAMIAAAAALGAAPVWAGPMTAAPPASARIGLASQAPSAPARLADHPPASPALRPATPTDPIVAHFSASYEGCMHKAGSTLDMIDCAAQENDRWDARLTRALQARFAGFNDRQRMALKRAQKAWQSFRDADCSAYEDEDWGSVSKIDASQCVLRRTVERTLELEAFPVDHGPG